MRGGRLWALVGGVVALVVAGGLLITLGLRSGQEDGAAAPLPAQSYSYSSVPDPVTGTSLPAVVTRADDGTVLPSGAKNPPAVRQEAQDGSQASGKRSGQRGSDGHGARPQVPSGPVADNHLTIPALGVDAAVSVNGTDSKGGLLLPEDVNRLTEWSGSAPITGTSGTIVVAGHVDNINQGMGALFYLAKAEPGDVLYLTMDGHVTRWKTVGLQAVVKAELPSRLWVGNRGPRTLIVVTCGGPFKEQAHHYRDNVVLTAVPF